MFDSKRHKSRRFRPFKAEALLLAALISTGSPAAWAQHALQTPSTTTTGTIGLNTIPSARMDETGTARFGLGFSDIYTHGFIGLQIADPLSVTLRQTAEISSPLNNDADRFYPGIDAKLRLHKESQYSPAIAIGVQSGVGHTRMSGEYITFSKRFKNFDFTTGAGWGRFGSAFTLKNPLKALSSHFGKSRALDGEMPIQPDEWFTGEKIGLFGGIEYFTPLKGLSLKADIGADRFTAEKAAFQYDTAAPWTLGANYHIGDWKYATIDTSLAAQGTERIMARLSISQNIANWRDRSDKRANTRKALAVSRVNIQPNASHIEKQAERDQINLQETQIAGREIKTDLSLSPHHNTPMQLSHAAVHIANNAGPDVERISITPRYLGLQGHTISIMRKDLENALAHDQGSADEIWQNTEITPSKNLNLTKRPRTDEINRGFIPFKLMLDHQFSFAEEDYGILHRTSLVAKAMLPRKTGYLDYGAALRLNLHDNLHHVEDLRPKVPLPVRSDVINFARTTVALDEAYVAFTHSLRSDLHISALAGYLEEMYAGAGGEILYRPLTQRFTLGAESYIALKRSTDTALNMGLSGDRVLTGTLNASYDVPEKDIEVTAKIGRFLAEDTGAQLGFRKYFENGATLDGSVTISNAADFDLFGGTTHANHMLRLTLPLGGIKYMPDYASVRITAKPFARDIGETLNNPLPLSELTEPFSLSHITRHWGDITP